MRVAYPTQEQRCLLASPGLATPSLTNCPFSSFLLSHCFSSIHERAYPDKDLVESRNNGGLWDSTIMESRPESASCFKSLQCELTAPAVRKIPSPINPPIVQWMVYDKPPPAFLPSNFRKFCKADHLLSEGKLDRCSSGRLASRGWPERRGTREDCGFSLWEEWCNSHFVRLPFFSRPSLLNESTNKHSKWCAKSVVQGRDGRLDGYPLWQAVSIQQWPLWICAFLVLAWPESASSPCFI